MAKIIDNPHGRRMIRLSSNDITMVVSMIQQQFPTVAATYQELDRYLTTQPLYIPEEV